MSRDQVTISLKHAEKADIAAHRTEDGSVHVSISIHSENAGAVRQKPQKRRRPATKREIAGTGAHWYRGR